MAKFENKRQENNKNNGNSDKQQEKHAYRFKVLHNGFKPEDREKMMKALRKEDDD
jgi:hypothetical protein